jgi:L-lactate dehydrogenase complex protein LldG
VEEKEMTERDKILTRVREALKVAAPLPGLCKSGAGILPAKTNAIGTPALPSARQWLPKVGESFDEQLALFQKNAAELKADFQLLASRDELKAALAKIAATENWKRIASHRGGLTDSIVDALGLPVCFTNKHYDVHELESCDAGVSECDALIAQTGSVLVTSRSAGGRALSVLPPHHVVIARREQLVADLPAAFDLLKQKYSRNYPSMISFITGPSRTGDIERILVLGAHGPKRLTIFLI